MTVERSQYAVLEHAMFPTLAQGPESEGATQEPALQNAPSTQLPVLAQESPIAGKGVQTSPVWEQTAPSAQPRLVQTSPTPASGAQTETPVPAS